MDENKARIDLLVIQPFLLSRVNHVFSYAN